MKTIEDQNKLIAEFMGITYEKNLGWYDNDMMLTQHVYDQQNGNCFAEHELSFEISWDWLMPVVIKIEEQNELIGTHILSTNINATYKAVVKFIKTYNETK
tara:strand:- start:172 stop:474 length:303 start_codon:yes stop_codon:yes gene_type:complete